MTVRPADLYDASKGCSGFIGTSLCPDDSYLSGERDGFRVYGRSLSASEVFALGGEPVAAVDAGPDPSGVEGAAISLAGRTPQGAADRGRCTTGHAFAAGGSYRLRVTVTDDDGGVDSEVVQNLLNGCAPVTGFRRYGVVHVPPRGAWGQEP